MRRRSRNSRELIVRWSDYEQPIYHGGEDSSFKLDLRANWKLAVDNYCESYHLPWCIQAERLLALEDHYTIMSRVDFRVKYPSLQSVLEPAARTRSLQRA